MEFPTERTDALSNINRFGHLCCPNCDQSFAIKMLGLRSDAKPNPRVTNINHVLNCSLWFYCYSCFTEFGSCFTHEEHSDINSSFVKVCSNVSSIKHNIKKESDNQKPLRKTIPAGLRYEVLKKDNHQCQSCGATVEDGAKLEIDHIIPVSKGGTNEIENLQVLCKTCNIGKSDKH